MENDYRHYTLTMARVYAGQGLWDKAAEIYRQLLRWEPDREDLIQALAEIEGRARGGKSNTPGDLVPLFRQWIDLLQRVERSRKLKRLLERSRSRASAT